MEKKGQKNMQEEEGEKGKQQVEDRGQEEEKRQMVAIRTHHVFDTAEQAEKVLHLRLRQKITEEVEQVPLPHRKGSLAVSLKRRPIQKPLHLLKIRKRINKRTKQLTHIVEKCDIIKHIYDNQQFCDFVSSEGCQFLKQQNGAKEGETRAKDLFGVDKEDLLNLVKKELQGRIQQRDKGQEPVIDRPELRQLIKPVSFLKPYNLVPPKCDFFLNKVKKQDQHHLSNSIGYADPLPPRPAQIPASIRQSELFKNISTFLERRPCWLKNVLLYTLRQKGFYGSFGLNELKNVLKYLCYTFRNGPWKHTFCLFSYDPRLTSKSVVFQSISLKLKKKQAQDYQQTIQQQLYDPTFTDISAKYIRAYQLGDLSLEPIQQMLRGKLISDQKQCSKEYGWLTYNQYCHVVKIMKGYKDKVYEQGGQE